MKEERGRIQRAHGDHKLQCVSAEGLGPRSGESHRAEPRSAIGGGGAWGVEEAHVGVGTLDEDSLEVPVCSDGDVEGSEANEDAEEKMW